MILKQYDSKKKKQKFHPNQKISHYLIIIIYHLRIIKLYRIEFEEFPKRKKKNLKNPKGRIHLRLENRISKKNEIFVSANKEEQKMKNYD